MTIECYVSACPFHSYHDAGPDEGPFCFHGTCQVTPEYIETVRDYRPDQDESAAIEKEHFGDPDKQTGIYDPDVIAHREACRRKFVETVVKPQLHHYSVRYEWKIGDDGKTLASTVYFDAMGHQDAMKQFFNIYNGSKPLVSLTIKKSRP